MEKKTFREITSIIFKALTLAMGVAVVVLSCLGSLELQTAVTLLGIGLACAGAAMRAKTVVGRESCPCRRMNCPRHGDCAACREHHHVSGRKPLTRCEKLARKEQRKQGKLKRRSLDDGRCI